MSLLREINETINEQQTQFDEYKGLYEFFTRAFEIEGLLTEAEILDLPLNEAFGERAAMARAGENDWVQGMKSDRERMGAQYKADQAGAKKFSLGNGGATDKPAVGDRVMTAIGPGQITDIEPNGDVGIAINDMKTKKETFKVVSMNALKGPKKIGGQKSWVI